jgi:hypothetical protein
MGANSKERQSNIQYNFKQIINSLIPALHRFFIHSSNRTNAAESLISGEDIKWME